MKVTPAEEISNNDKASTQADKPVENLEISPVVKPKFNPFAALFAVAPV